MGKSATTAGLPPEGSSQTPVRETVALEKLVTDGGTQVRSEISKYIVAEYVEALDAGARFPPVVVFRNKGADVLADGFHRVLAYRKAGQNEIEADVYQGDQKDALWFALGANRAHGQRLSGDEKRRAIEIAYKAWPDLSQRQIAAQVGCNQGYVGKVRARLNASVQLPDRVIGRDGRKTAATRPARGNDAPETANGQTRSASPNEATDTSPKRPEQAPVEPATEQPTESNPTTPGGERSKTRVISAQSAKKRSNRIVSVVVDATKNLMAQNDQVEFSLLDRKELPKWIEDLEDGRSRLGHFIRRLRQTVEDGVPSAPEK